MPPRKRASVKEEVEEPTPKRRSTRSTRATASASKPSPEPKVAVKTPKSSKKPGEKPATKPAAKKQAAASSDATPTSRSVSPDPHPDDIPRKSEQTEPHEGRWYWLMKAEPEPRFENGKDVSFSIDDLKACTKPEGWDGIRNYVARNNLRAMNDGDLAFFYHSNCKTPGIVGTMEIVREFSEDSKPPDPESLVLPLTSLESARRPGTPYYDASSTKDKPKWGLVHVEFRKKFAVPIYLPELREMGKDGKGLENMQLLKQSRLSVSRVSEKEWEILCRVADEKANEAGLKHEEA